jgi:sterol desaturase/sphingolipid hydroxylase (fatty acid hydroxylase superfamily)
MMLRSVLILLGYYVVAVVVLAIWTYRDHAATKRRVARSADPAGKLASRFTDRIAGLLGVLAAVGSALLLALLLTPAPAIWVVAAISLGDGVVTVVFVEVVLRFWHRWFGVDPLADLRPVQTPDTSAVVPEEARRPPVI